MNTVLKDLLKLQGLEFGKGAGKPADPLAAELRAKIPPPILAHYDRLLARGKKGVAVVQNQVCTGCHMRLPVGVVNTLLQGGDVQLCETCGRYLYLPKPSSEPAELPAPAPAASPKPRTKSRRRKKSSHAA